MSLTKDGVTYLTLNEAAQDLNCTVEGIRFLTHCSLIRMWKIDGETMLSSRVVAKRDFLRKVMVEAIPGYVLPDPCMEPKIRTFLSPEQVHGQMMEYCRLIGCDEYLVAMFDRGEAKYILKRVVDA